MCEVFFSLQKGMCVRIGNADSMASHPTEFFAKRAVCHRNPVALDRGLVALLAKYVPAKERMMKWVKTVVAAQRDPELTRVAGTPLAGTPAEENATLPKTIYDKCWPGILALKLTVAADGRPFDKPDGPPPNWLKAAANLLTFVVTDFYGSTSGTQVVEHRTKSEQQENTCGAVSAKVAHMQAVSKKQKGQWWKLATDEACGEEIWTAAYKVAFPGTRFDPKKMQSTTQIQSLLEHLEIAEPTGIDVAKPWILDEALIFIVKDLIARAWGVGEKLPTPEPSQPFPDSPIKDGRAGSTIFRRLIVNTNLNRGGLAQTSNILCGFYATICELYSVL
jgi:hypothetical protein